MLQAVEATTPVPAESAPRGGTFYSAQFPNWPPLPGNIHNVPVWNLSNGSYLLDDLDVNYSQQPLNSSMMAGGMSAMDAPSPDDGGSAYTFDTNQLWLEITNVSGGLAYLNLYNPTDQVYAVWSATNLLTGWQVETEVWPTDTNCTPFTVLTQDRQDLFLQAEDWTGVTENGNQTPDWWFWYYFGTTALSDTDLDSQGNTLLDDYQNGFDPNIISFSLLFTNQYVNTSAVSGTITVLGGVPTPAIM